MTAWPWNWIGTLFVIIDYFSASGTECCKQKCKVLSVLCCIVLHQCLRTLVGHTGGVWSSQMSGNTVISGSTDRTVKVWNADSGHCVFTLYGHTSTVRCMHLHEARSVSNHSLVVSLIHYQYCQWIFVMFMLNCRPVCITASKQDWSVYEFKLCWHFHSCILQLAVEKFLIIIVTRISPLQ